MEPTQTPKSNRKVVTLLVLLVIVLGATSGYLYKKILAQQANSAEAVQAEATELAQKVGKLIVLPEGEVPTVATVSDPEALKNQPFFVNAKVGDKVLIYTNAKKAVLYDPVVNKILNVAPLNIGEGQRTTTPAPAASTTPSSSSN